MQNSIYIPTGLDVIALTVACVCFYGFWSPQTSFVVDDLFSRDSISFREFQNKKKKEPFIEFSCVYSAKLLSIYISPPEIESFFIFEIII